MTKDPFKNLTIAASGAFGPARTYSHIRRWVENAGGRFATAINGEVTHLIADEDHWRDESPFVKDAKALGTVDIVTFDWLEDSLRKQRAYSTKKYLLTTIDKKNGTTPKQKKKEKKEESEEVKQFKKGAEAAKRDLQSDNYHVYVDNTGFPHNVTMTRVNVLANTSERIELSMYETDLEITKFYAVHVAYSGPNNAQEKKILVNPGAEFNDAFKKFRAAFKRVCLIPWEQRLIPEACNRSTFRDVEMHNRARKEMEKFGEIFTLKKPDGSWFDPQKMEDDEDEASEVGPDGKRKRGDCGKKRKRRKKNSDDSDDEERGIKLLSPEDLKACKILPFRYVPPPKGKPRGALPEFNRVVGHDDMKDDEDFLTMPKL